MNPGSVVAAAFVAAVEAEGLTPDGRLRILDHRADLEGGQLDGGAPTVDGPSALGPLHESISGLEERRGRGAWYTPTWLAEHLVEQVQQATTISPATPLVDPACGGGVFLLASVSRSVAAGVAPALAIESCWGADIDPVAVAVAEAALWWWSARAGDPVVAGDRLVVGDALIDLELPTAGAVVGNPPFRGQLRDRTWVTDDERAALRSRWGDVLGAYTDPAWLFLLAAVRCVRPGGSVAMIQPQSVLAARDAGPVRAAVDGLADMEGCWIDDGSAFQAAVDVCAPVLRRRGEGQVARPTRWTDALAEALEVPELSISCDSGVLGDVAEIRAGFRDEFYGLVDAVSEGGDGPRVVTSGSIDPFGLRPDHGARIGGRRYRDPRLGSSAVTGKAVRWVEIQRAPKVLVATQTKVIEAVADLDATMVGSVPVLVVSPSEASSVWHVLAVLQSPAASAWLMRASAGTALASGACKPTAALLRDLPLPTNVDAWDHAAALAGRLSREGRAGSVLEDYVAAACEMYGVADEALATWWLERLPER